MPQITYHHRDEQARVNGDQALVPFCVLCYNNYVHGRDTSFIFSDLARQLSPDEKGRGGGIRELAQITGQMIEVLQLKVPDADITNPHLSCPMETDTEEARRYKNQNAHLECATHYFMGLTLMAADQECQKQVAQKIAEQGLEGPVDVYLMDDFNFDTSEWRIAAKYCGNSVDLYTLKVKKDGSTESDFVEEPDDQSIETKIKEFFS